MLTRFPGRLKIPVTMLMIARIIVMVRDHDFPDHRPHVIMNPNKESMSNTKPMTIRTVVVKAIIGILVNVEPHGISLRTSAGISGMSSQPPAERNVLIPITPNPAINIKTLVMPSKIVRSVTPPGLEPL